MASSPTESSNGPPRLTKFTKPVGAPAPGGIAVTVAFKVAFWPATVGLGVTPSVVVELALPTVTDVGGLMLVVKALVSAGM